MTTADRVFLTLAVLAVAAAFTVLMVGVEGALRLYRDRR